MATWDTIYKKFNTTGEGWATIGQDIIPEFKKFINNIAFKYKSALDIGCGTGNYALFLIEKGFEVNGIDSSPTAIKIIKRFLGENANFKTSNMFNYKISKDKYDLIYSIAAIQHGYKKEIHNLIDRIYKNLKVEGWIFITLPKIESANKWNTFKKKKDLGDGTYSPLVGPEKGLPHSFYSKQDVEHEFKKFRELKIEEDKKGRWIIKAMK